MNAQHPAPFPTDGLRLLSPKEQLQRAQAMACLAQPATPSCQANLFIGLFFDGTGNNRDMDLGKLKHSNVVRLWRAHPDKHEQGQFAFYIPGVGTPFPEIGEYSSSWKGSGFAMGGEQRINWGILQIFNAINTFFTNGPLLAVNEASELSKQMCLPMTGLASAGQIRRQQYTRPWLDKLRTLIKGRKPTLTQINISVFGFSRGAAEARVFCNWFFELCEQQDGGYTFAGVPVRIYFAGLFDTVASVGLTNIMTLSDGHLGWADHSLHINPAIEQCVHFVAAHEVRACFPSDSVRLGKSYPPNCKEVVYPGTHSDVGGGYAPGAQGKNQNADFMALITAARMYDEAVKGGVPLLALADMPPQVKQDFTPSTDAITAFNDYLKDASVSAGSVEDMTRAHMNRYFTYRALHLRDWEKRPFFSKADSKDQKTLTTVNTNLRTKYQNIEAAQSIPLWAQGLGAAAGAGAPPVYDKEDKAIADVMNAAKSLPQSVVHFLDNYIHDSVAGFANDAFNEYQLNQKGLMRYRTIFSRDS